MFASLVALIEIVLNLIVDVAKKLVGYAVLTLLVILTCCTTLVLVLVAVLT